jgi:hypothetical protein
MEAAQHFANITRRASRRRSGHRVEETVQGVAVTFSAGTVGGSFSPSVPQFTNSKGVTSVFYTASTKAGKITVNATATGLHALAYSETITAGPATAIAVVSGNNQVGPVSTALPLALKVKVTDQYGNGVTGATVTYADGGAGGIFSADPVLTDSTGSASTTYTTPSIAETVTVNGTVSGVTTPASFNETAQ